MGEWKWHLELNFRSKVSWTAPATNYKHWNQLSDGKMCFMAIANGLSGVHRPTHWPASNEARAASHMMAANGAPIEPGKLAEEVEWGREGRMG